ncbi:MAG: UDP-N-acetylglucosamine 2-epimerase (non-hydrolyzing) [Candidatus Pacearchaeota archaeon]
MKITTILGTRPEIIKFSALIPLLEKEFDHRLIHTGQHYDYEMDGLFFKELKLKKPDYNLKVGSSNHGKQTAAMLEQIENILIKEKPEIVIVQGDTNSAFAGAIAASKIGIKIAHVEAGCRSFEKKTPEEINRVVIDHISDILFAPDEKAYEHLVKEGISKNRIYIVGSTIFDACLRNKEFIENSKITEKLDLTKDNFILVTLHRAENTNDTKKLKSIIDAFNIIAEEIDVVFPIHPRTSKIIKENGINLNKKIKLTSPLGYIDLLKLVSSAKVIISDSGGLQEEAFFFNIPCLITREKTEWTRLIEMGKNFLVGCKTEDIVKKTKEFIKNDLYLKRVKAIKTFFKKSASEKIIEILKNYKE